MVQYMLCMHVGMVTDHVKRHDQNLRGRRGGGFQKYRKITCRSWVGIKLMWNAGAGIQVTIC